MKGSDAHDNENTEKMDGRGLRDENIQITEVSPVFTIRFSL